MDGCQKRSVALTRLRISRPYAKQVQEIDIVVCKGLPALDERRHKGIENLFIIEAAWTDSVRQVCYSLVEFQDVPRLIPSEGSDERLCDGLQVRGECSCRSRFFR